MTTVERIFYSVLAFTDNPDYDVLPLARALRAVELHIRRECRREVDGLRAFKRSVDEALNRGDGSYRP